MSNGEVKVTSINDYRQKIGAVKTVTLPTGAIFKIRRLTVMDYIKEGLTDIPNEFFTFIAELSAGFVSKPESETAKKNIEIFDKFITITITKGIVEPPVIMIYDKEKADTHLIFSELNINDQKYLVDVITGRIDVG